MKIIFSLNFDLNRRPRQSFSQKRCVWFLTRSQTHKRKLLFVVPKKEEQKQQKAELRNLAELDTIVVMAKNKPSFIPDLLKGF